MEPELLNPRAVRRTFDRVASLSGISPDHAAANRRPGLWYRPGQRRPEKQVPKSRGHWSGLLARHVGAIAAQVRSASPLEGGVRGYDRITAGGSIF